MNNLATPSAETSTSDRDSGTWLAVGDAARFPVNAGIAVKIEGRQIAIYRFRADSSNIDVIYDEWYACDNACPHKNDNVLARGLIGDHQGELMVACPMHKKAFSLKSGACLNDPDYSVRVYPVRLQEHKVWLRFYRD